ncbi:hypothetical protein NDU88_004559 [Pleurodeles waltl]|uniref:Uncharacterized protein n=1 Tax=Pleurodeles waltl TaxID=8319 RepID=A0AAV7NNT8_PLEWA|nr:hypothetical protein NDU88_004559 [Pleurodeles waltl]
MGFLEAISSSTRYSFSQSSSPLEAPSRLPDFPSPTKQLVFFFCPPTHQPLRKDCAQCPLASTLDSWRHSSSGWGLQAAGAFHSSTELPKECIAEKFKRIEGEKWRVGEESDKLLQRLKKFVIEGWPGKRAMPRK